MLSSITRRNEGIKSSYGGPPSLQGPKLIFFSEPFTFTIPSFSSHHSHITPHSGCIVVIIFIFILVKPERGNGPSYGNRGQRACEFILVSWASYKLLLLAVFLVYIVEIYFFIVLTDMLLFYIIIIS